MDHCAICYLTTNLASISSMGLALPRLGWERSPFVGASGKFQTGSSGPL